MSHSFHISVLGLGYSIVTPLKVAKFGISSVVSIVDDELIERMRKFHLEQNNQEYRAIRKTDNDYRSKRITAYLNLLNSLVNKQVIELKEQNFEEGTNLTQYYNLLPNTSALKNKYIEMLREDNLEKKIHLQNQLKNELKPGAIEVNIMAKVDKINFAKNGDSLGDAFTDALSALRGFAKSDLQSAIILSAGMNPRLYSYLTEFEDFSPIG